MSDPRKRKGARPAGPHGTMRCYWAGCRCGECRTAQRKYHREARAAELEGEREFARTGVWPVVKRRPSPPKVVQESKRERSAPTGALARKEEL
jgi:hypothetical protein